MCQDLDLYSIPDSVCLHLSTFLTFYYHYNCIHSFRKRLICVCLSFLLTRTCFFHALKFKTTFMPCCSLIHHQISQWCVIQTGIHILRVHYYISTIPSRHISLFMLHYHCLSVRYVFTTNNEQTRHGGLGVLRCTYCGPSSLSGCTSFGWIGMREASISASSARRWGFFIRLGELINTRMKDSKYSSLQVAIMYIP